jgi:FixJ family two-component response regulator
MQRRHTIILIDSNFRHRAAIAHSLAGSGIHVEPFESVSELTGSWPQDGIILVHDEDGRVHHLLRTMTETGNWLPLIAYGQTPSTPRVVQAIMAGALDYLEWPLGESEVRQAIAVAEANAGSIGNARLREAIARSRIQKLTRREREVLAGVADGLSNRLIGERLAISPRTVEIHRANMLNKMGASHTSEAIRIAIEASLVA